MKESTETQDTGDLQIADLPLILCGMLLACLGLFAMLTSLSGPTKMFTFGGVIGFVGIVLSYRRSWVR